MNVCGYTILSWSYSVDVYFLWSFLKDMLYKISLHTVKELQ
jgi:hypothetical protein